MIEKIETPLYEDFYLVGTSNNMFFIGRVAWANIGQLELTEYCQLANTQTGMTITNPMFPAEKMMVYNPCFVIAIQQLEKKLREITCDALKKYFLQKNSGLILAKS